MNIEPLSSPSELSQTVITSSGGFNACEIEAPVRTRHSDDLFDDQLAERMLPLPPDVRVLGADVEEINLRDAASLGRQLEQLAHPRGGKLPLHEVQGSLAGFHQADAEEGRSAASPSHRPPFPGRRSKSEYGAAAGCDIARPATWPARSAAAEARHARTTATTTSRRGLNSVHLEVS